MAKFISVIEPPSDEVNKTFEQHQKKTMSRSSF
jgi:hypothetical protein